MTDIWTRMDGYRRLRWMLLVGVALAAGVIGVLSYAAGALTGIERQTVDARFSIRGPHPTSGKVAIVAVDQKTVRALGARPPIPRSAYATTLNRLHHSGARLIVVDAQFVGRTDRRDDGALLRSVAADGPLVLATNDTTQGPAPVPAGVHNARGAVLASAAVDPDPDGVLRRMMYQQIVTETMPVRAAALMTGAPVNSADFPGNHAWVDFAGPPGTFPTYSMIDVLHGRISPSSLTGKTVFVGVTDPVEKDVFATPASSLPMAGVEFNANALDTILSGFPLGGVSDATEVLIILALAALPTVLGLRLSSLYVVLASLVTAVVFVVAAQIAFNSGAIISVPDPILALLLGTIGTVAIDSFVQLRSHQLVFDLLPGRSDFFISYRRGQSELAANTLREGLARKFGPKHVFMDTEAIGPGERWPRRIEDAIASCRAMLVVIGPSWLEPDTKVGERRLDDPTDWVRREIEAGLARDEVVLVPVTHDGAPNLRRDLLPPSIQALADSQAVQLTGRNVDHWIADLAERIHVGRLQRFQRPADTVPAEAEVAR